MTRAFSSQLFVRSDMQQTHAFLLKTPSIQALTGFKLNI
ncbi:hypothetical protein O23A_p3292 [Aeromonas salmonicida]|nr:hypothetical protein O23A_p3292 [Aeromonas salmonicida]